ncbi:Naphthalene 1,2-dioxygenase/salicylate 5-hydroxylase systems, ferredoxin--NAD(P)(+), reductase component [Methylobacterium crusticola]|uniref:Naphthalene 1,2-dioxygenase/salicylate 5-hydroxylase systems, ferredoxin--NAD(P)(+), reductase component n=1 Tax=Methylobacterium crusticola TaxID=1697972 RepID=A0ABQ4QYY2_9HYPH|nr:2Fe-2S iron-sulfur cluster-binding protein [Methylobacterium crusticola]GJD50261.1 Naphthalene 1,2-dioxygenase/salicylate 5-hydroxylase systems, ferredoxin--NAD(P)(+), reductase component [Methylobacterium crusticola]
MAKANLVVNGRRIAATPGQTLLDAALTGRVALPHDCATGQCNTCRVRLYDGNVDPQGTALNDTVLACRATVTGDAVIEFDEVPPVTRSAGLVQAVAPLSESIVEVTVALARRAAWLPGQYVKVQFGGFPARDYSPSLRADGSGELNELIFHVRRYPDGQVSSQLGVGIRPGHPVRIRGPFGSAYHRPGTGRLVLVAGGVGWAPIWAIARAASLREPARPLHVVAGARVAEDLYMREACDWLSRRGARVTLTCSGLAADGPETRAGRPTLHVPLLNPTDTVVAAGAPGMVAAVELLCATRGATCHADPFHAAATPARQRDSLLGRLLGLMPGSGRKDGLTREAGG